jgi:hypothetical protein
MYGDRRAKRPPFAAVSIVSGPCGQTSPVASTVGPAGLRDTHVAKGVTSS